MNRVCRDVEKVAGLDVVPLKRSAMRRSVAFKLVKVVASSKREYTGPPSDAGAELLWR